MREPTLLLTGFEPFNGDASNPLWTVAEHLRQTSIHGHRIVSARLSTSFRDALGQLYRAIDTHAPAMVMCLGLAGGRAQLCFERVAVNLIDARIPDNADWQPIDVPVIDGGPAAYFARLPLKAMLDAVTRAGIPAHISFSAGSFVCNQVFYGLMHRLQGGERQGGFMHVPYTPQLAVSHSGAPSMHLDDMVEGVRLALEAAFHPEAFDAHRSAGREH